MSDTSDLDLRCINTIRTLSMDAVQAANSGHPGTPMALAPVAYCLWQRFLRFDPEQPIWGNRDRFVLSNGHASMLLYSLLHLAGVKAVNPKYEVLGEPSVKLDDIKRFRQLDSKCPGHPEYRWTSGVETTTGPLGAGAATSVGMAVASQWLGARYNLDGHTDITFTEDVAGRFVAYGWNVTSVADANDLEQVAKAFHDFKAEHERPTLVVVHSHIGYGTPVEDTPKAHGEPLGPEGVKATKRFMGWPEDAQF